jgi:hypothetical protein
MTSALRAPCQSSTSPSRTSCSRAAVYASLAEAGVPTRRIPRLERVISSIVLGFLVSEAGGRLGHHSRRVLDADFGHIRGLIASLIRTESQLAT